MKVYIFDPAKRPPAPPCICCGQPSVLGHRGATSRMCRPCTLIWDRHGRQKENAASVERQRRLAARRRQAEARP